MNALRRWAVRTANLLRRRQDARLQEEIAGHIEALTEENLRAGMSRSEAQRHARMAFGSQEALREQWHGERSFAALEHLLADTRHAARRLARAPGLAAAAIVTLALGIGANVAVFGVLNAVVLEPLPVAQPQQLYQLRPQAWSLGKLLTSSYPAYREMAARNRAFLGMAAVDGYAQGQLQWGTESAALHGDAVSGNYFSLLGVRPQLGRFFDAADEHGADSAPFLVLSDAVWRSVFHADRGIVGQTVLLDQRPFTVLGVASKAFHGLERFTWPDYWMPLMEEGSGYLQDRSSLDVTVVGRLRPGFTPRQAMDDLNAVAAELAREYPLTDRSGAVRLVRPGLYGDEGEAIRGFLWGVSGLALLVLFAACANLANLFAARAADRRHELALRLALGSTRLRVARQVVLEVLLLAVAGGAAGLAAAVLLLRALSRWQPASGGHVLVATDARVYAAAMLLTAASVVLAALLPARQVWRGVPVAAMREGTQGAPRRWAARDALLAVQIAVCALLVCASYVAVRSMEQVLHAPLGFAPQGASLVDVDLSDGGRLDDAQQAVALEAVLDAAQGLPGVTAAGAVSRLPMTGGMHGTPVFRQGVVEFTRDHAALEPYVFEATPGYLAAAGSPLLQGRDLARSDDAASPDVAVVNQTFARRMWPQGSALGRRFIVAGRLTQVAGIVADAHYHDLEEPLQPAVFLPYAQAGGADATFVVRSALPPGQLATALQHAVAALLPDAPVSAQSWPAAMADVVFPARAAAGTLGVIGGLAVLLAVTGIFGMAAYAVSRRRRELGIRVALGATRVQLLRATLGRIAVLLAAGSLAGVGAALLATGLLSRVAYRPQPWNPLVLCATVLTMLALGLAAAAIPARRALAIDPAQLMREE